MNNQKIGLTAALLMLIFYIPFAQNIQVETVADLDASGGITLGPDGNVYVSDFGPALGTASMNTKVYKMEYGTWEITEFASGFSGASGNRFDSQGNFYQSNPSGGRVSKVTPDGNIELNWVTAGMSGGPIGLTSDPGDNLYVCNCGNNSIQKVTPEGVSTLFSSGNLFNCPNGITIDPDNNLYVCNFNNGRVIKITPDGNPSLLTTLPTNSFTGTGNGHINYSNGFLFVATIGTGQIYKLSLSGQQELIAGISHGYSNIDGPGLEATFSKPNGIVASVTGDTLWINCSVPTWATSTTDLHPGLVRMVTGVCSLEDVDCPLLTSTKNISPSKNKYATLFPPTPNPVNHETLLSFEINGPPQQVKLSVIDEAQRVISTVFEGRKSAGSYAFNLQTESWTPGVYYVILKSQNFNISQKIIVVK